VPDGVEQERIDAGNVLGNSLQLQKKVIKSTPFTDYR
jgi:hypothetical protein